jgi:hypothetical protein
LGRACSTYGRQEKWIVFWWEDIGEIDCLQDLGVDGRIILKWIFKKWNGGMDWIVLA